MSARFGAGISSQLTKTTGLIDYNQPYTVMCWAYFLSTPGSDQTVQSITSGSLNSFDLFGRMTSGATRLISRSNGGAANTTTGSVLALNTWHHIAMRRNSSSSISFILNGSVDTTNNATNVASREAVSAQHVGEQVGGFADMDGWVGAIKEFNVALTDADIAFEMETFLPKILDSRLTDLTPVLPGNRTGSLRGGGWSEVGTVVDAPNPPIAWGGAQILTFPPVATAGGGSITSSLDAYLQKQISITASADAQIQKTLSLTNQADAYLQKALILISNADALLQSNKNATSQADALVQKAIALISSADAILVVQGSSLITSNADAYLQKIISIISSADAILQRAYSLQSSADAILAKTNSIQSNADGLLQKNISLITNADSFLQKTLSSQSNADAILSRLFLLTSSADAIILGLTNIFSNADALLQRIDISLVSNADAILQLPGLSIRTRRWNGLKHFDKNGKLR